MVQKICQASKKSFYVFAAAWLALLIEGVSFYPKNGILILLSILWYWITQDEGLGLFNNFRALIFRKPSFQSDREISNFFLIVCVIYFGYWLI